jgi:penicillin-binding protein 1B
LEAAVVVIRSDSGEVAAMVGARKSRFAGFNRALDAQRPVGSLIKPVVYLVALRQPQRYTLATLLEDAPLRVKQAGSPVWTPKNYDEQFHGQVLLIQSLAQSYNVSTARLGMAVGVENVVAEMRQLGISRHLQPFPSLLLGAIELTPVEVAQMYLTFASGGFRTPLRSIRSVLSQDQQPLARYPLSVEQVIEPGPMALLNYGLQEVVRSGTARVLRGRFPEGMRVSGKTGTTDDYRDSWFAGYAGGYLTVVWLGRDDNQPVGLSGASGATLVWADIMRRLDLHSEEFPLPLDIELVAVDPSTGRLADKHCEGVIELPFIVGSAPTERAPCASPRVNGKVGGKLRNWFNRLFRR